MIKGAIFDVDGTLLDSMKIWNSMGERYLAQLGIQAKSGLGKILFTMTIDESAVYLKETYNLSATHAEIVKALKALVQNFYETEAPLKVGVKAALAYLSAKEIPMAVATASEREMIEAAFKRLGIEKYFKKIFTCSEVGAAKNQPLIFQKAGAWLGVLPQETLVFEDGLYAIQTAKRAGFLTIGLYDEVSQSDWPTIKNEADAVLEDMTNFEVFWENISEGR
jgi:HAD superfamily hydrolase (TIGR01509 family)